MKKIKSIHIGKFAWIMAMVFTVTACQEDEIIEMAKPSPQGEYISFHIQRGWDYDEISRSAESEYGKHLSNHILVSEDKTESIEMSTYQQPIDSWFEKPSSRGTMITKEGFNEFMAFGYQTKDGTTTQIFNTHHQKEGGMWEQPKGAAGSENEDGYYWEGADYTYSFFGIAMSDNKLTNQSFYTNVETTTNDAGQIVSFDYTVPEAAIDQPDIMVAATGNVKGDGSEGATLNFKHILSAINIKVGTASFSKEETVTNVTINSITFNNIYAKGSYNIGTGLWSNTAYYDDRKSFTVDFEDTPEGDNIYTEFQNNQNAIMNKTGATFMFIPQTLRNDATVEINYTVTIEGGSTRNTTSTATIGGNNQVWEAGKAINYVLNINNEDGVEFITADSYVDAHYITLPLNIKSQNPGGTVTLRAVDATGNAVNWVQFREELIDDDVEKAGWWADPDNIYEISQNQQDKLTGNNNPYVRTSTLDFTESSTYYAFLTENIGTVNREVRLQLLLGGVVQDEIKVTQLCPTWDTTGNKGCERIEEGETLPWGYRWTLKDNNTEYKTTVTVPEKKWLGFIEYNRIWALIYNLINGSPGDFQWNGVYTFDFSDFIANMTNAETGAGSTTDGLQNTTYMFNYTGDASALTVYSYFIKNLDATINSTTFEGEAYDEFAAKEALKKNKVRIHIGQNSVTNEYEHSPVIDASRTDLWYLPATGEVGLLQNNTDMIEGVETLMKTGDIFWTSTAATTPNAYSYIWGNPGSTPTADRDNAYRVRAIRDITSTSSTTN